MSDKPDNTELAAIYDALATLAATGDPVALADLAAFMAEHPGVDVLD